MLISFIPMTQPTLNIPFVEKPNIKAHEVSSLFATLDLPRHTLDVANWNNEFPYKPQVDFAIAHNGESIIIEYRVAESHVRAMATEPNGSVWLDSCVEMFITFDDSVYYNVECNCAGTILMAQGPGREGRTPATAERIGRIDRVSSIDTAAPFDTKEAPAEWRVSMVVPINVFTANDIKSLRGMKARANFYKCGDMLPAPHFLSLFPVGSPNPNFHLPEFFGEVSFE